MSCHLCALLDGLRQNVILPPLESPYETGIRRGAIGGFVLAYTAGRARKNILLCAACDEQVQRGAGILDTVLAERD